MQQIITGLRRSASVKAATIGFLILLLLIPVSMIEGVVQDRSWVLDQARSDVMQSWGGQQIVGGPVLVVPYTIRYEERDGDIVTQERRVHVLPSALEVSGSIETEIRYRGAHEVPVYNTSLDISGSFDKPDIRKIDTLTDTIHWDKTYVSFLIAEARAITATPSIDVGPNTASFRSGAETIFTDMPIPIVADIGNPFADDAASTAFRTRIGINGTDSLKILPLGDTTKVSLKSTWPSPSFVGNYLPATRTVTDDGFSAEWEVSSLARALPSQWHSYQTFTAHAHDASFGVALYMPVSLYQLMFRAVRYAVLFIALSFVAYFLFEVMARLRLHPLQYLLVGFANAMFFLLLLSLAEHLGFALAYMFSALASAGLIASYSGAILRSRIRGLTMGGILAGLYGFLYVTLNAETYALLTGAIALWIVLAAIMVLTRRIDWYERSDQVSVPET